jgi:aminodeoxychorismate synthase component I
MRREDKITPSSAYHCIREVNSFLFESVKGGENIAASSFVGFSPFLVVKANGDRMIVSSEKGETTLRGNPFHLLRGFLKEAEAHPDFKGAFGYFGYELAWFIEDLPKIKEDALNLPDLYLIFPKHLIVFDHKLQRLNILSPDREEIAEKIKISTFSYQPSAISHKIDSNFTKEGYIRMVERCKEYIKAGDIYQANLSQRLSAKIDSDPFLLYQRLTAINPSPFSAFLELDGFSIVSSSPERLIKVNNGRIETRPIAGTRPRGKIETEDEKLASELILSQKERAEHIMLVDLERNDIGRVSQYGTVKVDELMVIERYSHVMHIVSNISGKLKPDVDFIDCILATFPGGTITGVPKVRCMEIINELEPTKRGPYTGSIGYIGFDGTMDLNIIIRTFIIKDGIAYIQAGGGIVADSEPSLEYYETLHKAEALVQSLTI